MLIGVLENERGVALCAESSLALTDAGLAVLKEKLAILLEVRFRPVASEASKPRKPEEPQPAVGKNAWRRLLGDELVQRRHRDELSASPIEHTRPSHFTVILSEAIDASANKPDANLIDLCPNFGLQR